MKTKDIGEIQFRHPDHPRPRTRREFLAQGLLGGAAWLMSPSLMGLFSSREARAQAALECGLVGGDRIPFLVFDLAGGASLAGSNVLVGTNGQRDPLSVEGYRKMGLPADRIPTDDSFVDTSLGLAFHSESALLRGILSRAPSVVGATPEVPGLVNGCVFCARSDNDTENNPHNPIYGIHAAGAGGLLLPLIGTRASDSGGRSEVPMSIFDPSVRPTVVSAPRQATGLVDTGRLSSLLENNAADVEAVMAATERISALKTARLTESEIVKSLIGCAYQETTRTAGQFGSPSALDPRLDPTVNTVISVDEINTVRDLQKTATVAKLVCDGYAGAGTIEFAGYDYHDGTRASGEMKDERAGQAIGAALQIAFNKNTPLLIYILSDGSVSSDGAVDNSEAGAGKLVWRGDSSSTAATVMLAFHPTQRPELTAVGNQVGFYRASGSIETGSSAVGDNVTALAEAAVLNYLALHGAVGEFGTVLPNSSLGTSAAVLDPLTAFAPMLGS